MVDLVALQDTSSVPPRSRFELRPMPADWDATHPDWDNISEPTTLRSRQREQ